MPSMGHTVGLDKGLRLDDLHECCEVLTAELLSQGSMWVGCRV